LVSLIYGWQSNEQLKIPQRLQDEREMPRVSAALLEKPALQVLIKTFSHKSTSFENILEPLLKILRLSKDLTIALSSQTSFNQKLIERLGSHSKPVVRLSLLKLVKVILDADEQQGRRRLAVNVGLKSAVENLANGENGILVKELAKDVLKDLQRGKRRSADNRGLISSRSVVSSASKVILGNFRSASALTGRSSTTGEPENGRSNGISAAPGLVRSVTNPVSGSGIPRSGTMHGRVKEGN
jgi:hypothetical protein